jgi:hypothetical protein
MTYERNHLRPIRQRTPSERENQVGFAGSSIRCDFKDLRPECVWLHSNPLANNRDLDLLKRLRKSIERVRVPGQRARANDINALGVECVDDMAGDGFGEGDAVR